MKVPATRGQHNLITVIEVDLLSDKCTKDARAI